jgi:endonuclease-8
MPEGDTIYRASERVGAALTGHRLSAVSGSAPPIRATASQLTGALIERVRSVGKHLLIETDKDLVIRTHMRMSGVWEVYPKGARWRHPIGAARAVLEQGATTVVCFSASDVSVDNRAAIQIEIDHLGPDLCLDDFDRDEAIRRMSSIHKATIAEHLTDQRVMAGIGNVYKSEILFLERIHPEASALLAETGIERVVDRSRQLLMLNRSRPNRITTGETRRGAELWVYGRGGQPCRRCRTKIEAAWIGDVERITYWCPNCQPQQPNKAP